LPCARVVVEPLRGKLGERSERLGRTPVPREAERKRERVVVDALRTDERCDLLVSLARIERRAAGELRPTGEQRCVAGTPVRWVLQVCVDRRLGLL
jgi:hypothetical protein